MIGTASYMSPEQARGELVDPRSDIFSLGAILVEMLTGRPAFTRENAADTLAAILKEHAATLPATIPLNLERLVSRCLEKSREARFQSARDLAFALEGMAGGTAVMKPEEGGSRSFGLRAVPFALTAVLGATVAVVTMAWFWGTPAPPPIPTIIPGELDPELSISDSITTAFGQSLAISPDGNIVAFWRGSEKEGIVCFTCGGSTSGAQPPSLGPKTPALHSSPRIARGSGSLPQAS